MGNANIMKLSDQREEGLKIEQLPHMTSLTVQKEIEQSHKYIQST